MITAIFRMSDIESNLQALATLGLFADKEWYAESQESRDTLTTFISKNNIKHEQLVGGMNCPYMQIDSGDYILTVKLSPADAALIPEVTSPDFLCDWRDDELFEEALLPYPQYDVPDYDENGVKIGTKKQYAPRIF